MSFEISRTPRCGKVPMNALKGMEVEVQLMARSCFLLLSLVNVNVRTYRRLSSFTSSLDLQTSSRSRLL